MKPLVCWDFDETLGYFRPHEFAWTGLPKPASMPPPRLKPGISALLEALHEFTHVVTTAAIGAYARAVLAEHGLLRHFAAVFGREDGMWPKDYGVVGRRFGISEEDFSKTMLIVGNDPADADCRSRQVVMIYDPLMADRPAETLRPLLGALIHEGEVRFDRCRVEGFSFEYWGNYEAKRTYPVVRTILPMC
ncbi:MAG: hypothetical protein QOD26_1444 [Betaproteobacteria bacterium]|nr:hypothetical protein [Betaproteobacteria bacterium]